MKKYIFLLLAFVAGNVLLPSCSDDFTGDDDNLYQKDAIIFDLTISGAATRADSPGEDLYNENKISSVCIFLFDENADEDADGAVLRQQATLSAPAAGSTTPAKASITFGTLRDQLASGPKNYTVVAVANCPDIASVGENPTLATLRSLTVTNRSFRSGAKQESFVMTSFDNPVTVSLSADDDLVEGGTVKLRRVASKIRMALDVTESVRGADGDTWFADLNNMRLYISNGVNRARLDGKISTDGEGTLLELEEDDYFHIRTQGSTDNDDFNFARRFSKAKDSSEDVADDYPYYNPLPYYSYPNKWTDGMTESHQTTLTIVVPWKDKAQNETVYKPTYYVVPLNNDNEILSNTYYYLRARINMMGSETPSKPMPVEMKCEIANWGTADDTNVSLRPLRFLIFNDDEFEVYNETVVNIPFTSTHPCRVVDFKGKFYEFTRNSDRIGDAEERNFDESTQFNGSGSAIGEGKFCSYKIDNTTNTLTFTHDFFNIWSIPNNINVGNIRGPYTRQNQSDRHKLYSKIDIYITVQHDTGQTIDAGYTETVHLTIYPDIYVTTEYIDPTGSPFGSRYTGWLLINGYSTSGSFDALSNNEPGSGQTKCLTTFTVTNLDEEEAAMWNIGDPRTYYINNELDNTSMKSDLADHLDRWTSNPPYNGTQTNRHTNGEKNVGRVIWEYFTGPVWNIGTWSSATDFWNLTNQRTISYYYPADESVENEKTIAPRFMAVSYHTRAISCTREEARRRCATLQQYGYPAGRWRLPTKAEVEIMRALQNRNVTHDIYGATPFYCAQGSTNGRVDADGHIDISYNTTNSHWVRCVYDSWYWEQVDADGHQGMNRIPDDGQTYTLHDGSSVTASNKELWKYFTWGDRPKENPQTRGGGKYSVEKFLEKHKKGVYPVKRKK